MNTEYSGFLLFRFIVITLLSFGLLSQAACTSSGRGWIDSREEDLSKIYVNPFGSSGNLQLPGLHGDAPQILTRAVEQQLLEENRLQTGYGIHSLTLQGLILSYQDDVLDVQGELYDDDEFLVYSRVKRHLQPGDDWEQGLNLVVEQMLDELMRKMSEVHQDEYIPHYAVTPGYFVVDDRYYYGNDYYGSYYYDAYYADWGWWRHHPRHHHDHDDEHHHSKPHDKPKPTPHWVSDTVFEALPRTGHIHEEKTRKREQAEHQYQAPTETGFGGNWGGGSSSHSNDYRAPASSSYDHTPAPQKSESYYRGYSSPSRSTPSYTPPQSHHTEHHTEHHASPPPKPESTPAPRIETGAPASHSSSSHSSGASGAAPGSHKHKRD